MPLSPDAALRCPTCGAAQPWQPECRRCRCDLTLYVATLQEADRWRQLALRSLQQGQYEAAVDAAQRCEAIQPGPAATRLLAVANLLAGRYTAACRAYARKDSGLSS
ncbi:hypothetical protein [Lignipirellula cremea]|uniref:Tetratricopeptide repeat protein n=1 Tax=Lignipirellula cremea TaxID=2528010 RepID=A0A518E3T6_9BACT|nr:hypothetical protein [Lignipirellula cremea]QDU98738.1 hypothetical protein Pla8534_66110 [Lignipirellula cremea]